MDKNESFDLTFESVIKSVPLVIGLLIICGSLHLDFYYSYFNINVFKYLDTSEILTSFFGIIHTLLIIFILIVLYLMGLHALYTAIGIYPVKKIAPLEQPNPSRLKRLLHSLGRENNISKIIIFLSLTIPIVNIFITERMTYNTRMFTHNYWIQRVLFSYAVFGSLLLMRFFDLKTKIGAFTSVIFISMIILSYSINSAITQVEYTVTKTSDKSIIYLEKDTITTNAKYVYVGRTNNHMFFYDLEKGKADIIPQNTVKKVSFYYPKP